MLNFGVKCRVYRPVFLQVRHSFLKRRKTKLLKKIYDKSKIGFAVGWIVAYCVLMSLGDSLSGMLGVQKSITLAVAMLLSAVLLTFLAKNRLFGSYGICRPEASARSMLYYLPLVLMLSANLWYGFAALNYGALEALLYVFTMLLVGLLEEIIFRGLLFEAMRGDSPRAAIIVSSLTFGIGHIINLFNGSGAELVPNLLQVVYATAAGFMFVMMYCKSGSLVACILSHGVFNALSAFANEADASAEMKIISAVLLTVITASYGAYIAWSINNEKRNK